MVESGYCDKHSKDSNSYDRYRGSAASRGYNSKWNKERDRFLNENPLCVECMKEKRIKPATVVDHRIPHKGDPVLFWDKTNWQGLCKKHHDIKTATEDGGFGNGKHRNF